MKTIPIYLNDISLRVDISLPSEVSKEDYIKTITEIKEKLGSMGEGALVDALTKITPGTQIEAVTISSKPFAEATQIFNQSSTVPGRELQPYILNSGKYAGKMLQHCPPEELLMLLDMAAYTLSESDKDAIRGLRKKHLDSMPREEPEFELPPPAPTSLAQRFNDDDIPF